MNYTDRVAKGAAELDRILPGWEKRIDLDGLNLVSQCNCVLGQLQVDLKAPILDGNKYGDALDHLYPHDNWFEQYRWAADRGFSFPEEATESETRVWDDLTEAWKRLIRQRLEA